MKASFRWLRALLPDLTASPAEVAARLTNAGLEVESSSAYGVGLDAVVVAAVRKIEPHPTKSGLRLVTVDRGQGHEQRVVCGAPNVPAPGGLVALAPLGTHLPAAGITLTAREIGGVVSEGMLCSEEELGLVAGASEGILVLPSGTAEPGTTLPVAVPGTTDTIFEIGVTPNRPDALGHVGLARELAALYGLRFSRPEPGSARRSAEVRTADLVEVAIDDLARCPSYAAAALLDVSVGESPAWLRYRLASLGVRPISNVVDVTNLVLLEYGHPMHAFDFDKVRGSHIEARRARPGEVLETLDGAKRALDPDDLVIADSEGPVALAGVMGGASSEISGSTRRVLLECAYFEPRGIRRSARRHGMHTESSHRFERGVDPTDTHDVLARALSLISELAGGAATVGIVEAGGPPARPTVVPLRGARVDALLGAPVPFGEALGILGRLGFGIASADAAAAQLTVPGHRPDITREVDLIEEVARVRGLDAIPTVLPPIRPQPPRATGILRRRVRTAAVELGLDEAVTFGFVSPAALEAVGAPPSPVIIANPLSVERSVMRTSLLPGLLDAVAHAFRHGEQGARLFTVGARFLPRAGGGQGRETSARREDANGSGADARLPDERPSFAAVLAGARPAYLARAEAYDLYDAKAIAFEMVERVTRRPTGLGSFDVGARPPHLHPRAAAVLLAMGRPVGTFGLLHPDVLDRFEIEGPVAAVEIDLRELGAIGSAPARFSPIARVPAATRDIALVVHDDVPAGEVERAIREVAGPLCESVVLFDLFRAPTLPKDHRSLAFHVVYRDPRATTAPAEARTLTDAEVDERHAAVVAAATPRFGATLRA